MIHKKKEYIYKTGLLCIITIAILFYPYPNPRIIPKDSPEIILWGGYVDDNRFSYAIYPDIELINKGIENGINMYLLLRTSDKGFLCIDNAPSMPDQYRQLRNYLNDTLKSEYIKGIVVDAEPPQRYEDYYNTHSITEYIDYIINNYPSQEELEESKKALEIFIDMVHEDKKQAILVRLPKILELEFFTRNIYSFELDWDYSVTMLYRRQTNNISLSSKWFYREAKRIENGFIGSFNHEYGYDNYIKNKEYLNDLDILRHFEVKQVWIFNYWSFKYYYGNAGFNELINHNSQFSSWELIL